MKAKITIAIYFLIVVNTFAQQAEKQYINLAIQTLDNIYKFYRADEKYLLNETFPFNPKNIASYTVSQDTITKKRVAYLWPTSGVFSGVNALLRATGDLKYKNIIDSVVLPGLELYFDRNRTPFCYQSYVAAEGQSDRFYDDNVWLAIDFADLYLNTKDKKYLDNAELLWKFIISGWSDEVGGGIFWCEQKKQSKNTCSNAPSVVAAIKLYESTQNMDYLNWAVRIYNWTKTTLQDKIDFLYFDNISLNNKIDKAKYSYNSGQMLEGAVLLYKQTKNKNYLKDARNIAKSAIYYFTEPVVKDGHKHRIFKGENPWFTTVLMRGYLELYKVEKDKQYINIFKDNLDYIQKYARSNFGLFEGNWRGDKKDEFKWLLNQACIVEFAASLGVVK